MGKRKGKIDPFRLWMSGNRKSGFQMIYRDMFSSPAFRDLTSRQRDLYLHMRMEYNPTKKDHPNNNENQFYFNKGIYNKTYKLYTNDTLFYRDRDALIEKGFITQVESGKTTQKRSIYKFSDNWKRYDPKKPFEFDPNERTCSMINSKVSFESV